MGNATDRHFVTRNRIGHEGFIIEPGEVFSGEEEVPNLEALLQVGYLREVSAKEANRLKDEKKAARAGEVNPLADAIYQDSGRVEEIEAAESSVEQSMEQSAKRRAEHEKGHKDPGLHKQTEENRKARKETLGETPEAEQARRSAGAARAAGQRSLMEEASATQEVPTLSSSTRREGTGGAYTGHVAEKEEKRFEKQTGLKGDSVEHQETQAERLRRLSEHSRKSGDKKK